MLLERDLSVVIEYKINIVNTNDTKLKILPNKEKVEGDEKEKKRTELEIVS